MLDVEVGIDERLQFTARRRLLYCLRHTIANFLQAVREGRCKQVLFAVEVTIEAAVRQAQVPHQIADACALASSAAESAGGRSDDSFARLLLVLGRISHDQSLDVMYHLIACWSSEPDLSAGLAAPAEGGARQLFRTRELPQEEVLFRRSTRARVCAFSGSVSSPTTSAC
jgi:hypothetical protein